MAKSENPQNELATYIPRHIRLGLPANVEPDFICTHYIEEQIPVVDENKHVVCSVSKFVPHKPSETIGKFKASDFDIDMLQAAGVPLKLIEINRSNNQNLQEIARAVSQLSDLEAYAKLMDEQSAAYNDFFNKNTNSEN